MPTAADIFPSKYLKAADLGTSEPVVTIREVTMETLGDDTKPVLYFQGKDKGVVLNKTNWNTIVDITGEEDSDRWAGAKIKLYVAKVEFQGKRVLSIRIDEPKARRIEPEPHEVDETEVGF